MIFQRKKVDFTEGKIMPKLLTFTIPIILSGLLQMLYNAADMMVVSMSDEVNAVGAVGSAGPFSALVVNLFLGFSVGANVTIARHIGAKNQANARKAVHTAVMLAVVLGILGMIFGLAISRTMLIWMGISDAAFELCLTYVRIYFLSVPFIAVTNFLIAVFRAKGDSATPLKVLAISGLVNVILNIVMVLGLGLSVEGVAIATVVANVVSAAIFFVKLRRSSDEYTSLSYGEMRIDRSSARDIFYIGLPSAAQGTFISITNIVVQSSIATVDKLLTPDPTLTPVLNGNAAAANLDAFVYMGMNSVYQGVMSFTGQNFGAKKPDRIKRGFLSALLIVFCVGITVSGVMAIFRGPLLSLYGIVNGEPGTAAAIGYTVAMERMIYITLPYFLCGFMEVSMGVLRGLGKSITAFVVSFFGLCALRVCWNLFVFPQFNTATSIFIGNPITWIITSSVGITLAFVYTNRQKKKWELELGEIREA